jgi:hypothetical protein
MTSVKQVMTLRSIDAGQQRQGWSGSKMVLSGVQFNASVGVQSISCGFELGVYSTCTVRRSPICYTQRSSVIFELRAKPQQQLTG